jgi:hypothetical protein
MTRRAALSILIPLAGLGPQQVETLRPEVREVGGARYAIVAPRSFPAAIDLPADGALVVLLGGSSGTVALTDGRQTLRADGRRIRYVADARSGGRPAVLAEGLAAGRWTVELRRDLVVVEAPPNVFVDTDRLFAKVCTEGYTSGVCAGSLFDKATGARDPGWGLDIVDWLMQPDPAAQRLDGRPYPPPYDKESLIRNRVGKPYVETPQICTAARRVAWEVVRGSDFAAVHQWWSWTESSPGFTPGSRWDQWLVFRPGVRHFFASDSVTSRNSLGGLTLRIDMPGHVKHRRGDTFSRVWLSYLGEIPAAEFSEDFPPEARFHYKRGVQPLPERLIRGYRLRAPSGAEPWLAGLTLAPETVSEAWCHQRGYVCFIQEIGGVPVSEGDRISSAHIVGYFDSPEEASRLYDRHRGHRSLAATPAGWKLSTGVAAVESGSIVEHSWGLSPDSLTEGEWDRGRHARWTLGGVSASGSDRDEKVAGSGSLYLVTRPSGGPSYAEWGDYDDLRKTARFEADYARTVDGIHDVKDLGPYGAVAFSMRREATRAGPARLVLYGVDRSAWAEYRLDLPEPGVWRQVRLDLGRPNRTAGGFDRRYTVAVRFEFSFREACKVWLDDLRLEAAK